jgi:hypothetical protein
VEVCDLDVGLRRIFGVGIDRVCSTFEIYWGADNSLARPTSRCILFDGENISFDACLNIYIYK